MNPQTNALTAHLTRRRITLAAAGIGLGGLTTRARANAADEITHAAESIHQEPVFRANRKRVYEALIDPKQFAKIVELSGAMTAMSLPKAPVEIAQQAGGAFSLFGGHIVGRHIELVANVRIVQAWRTANWDAGVYSIARFEFKDEGAGTKILFDHTSFPAGQAQHLADGWKANYWRPLEKYLSA
jgi:activator of HSP90 ATPase